jgi:hypothetical protein
MKALEWPVFILFVTATKGTTFSTLSGTKKAWWWFRYYFLNFAFIDFIAHRDSISAFSQTLSRFSLYSRSHCIFIIYILLYDIAAPFQRLWDTGLYFKSLSCTRTSKHCNSTHFTHMPFSPKILTSRYKTIILYYSKCTPPLLPALRTK